MEFNKIYRNTKTAMDILDKIFPEGIDKTFESLFPENNIPAATQDFFSQETEVGKQYAILLPGVTKENLKITSEGENIFVEAKVETWYRKATVKKQILVGFTVDPNEIAAVLKDGVLILVVNRKRQSSNRREIKLQ